MKILRIDLNNFKQFRKFHVLCKQRNVLVGPNNAGKSTVLDALRIVADVLKVAKRLNPTRQSHEGDGVCATYSLSKSAISIPLESINRDYGDEPALISIKLENGNQLKIILGLATACYAYLKTDGQLPASTSAFRRAFPIDLVIAPTLGTLEADEKYLADQTVSQGENTRLAHRHFRNILIRKSNEEFQELADLVKETWPGTTISKPTMHGNPTSLSMMYEERRIPRELHWSGFGFQVWLQTLLQLTRGNTNSILVLDEPDIYLHADLQRKLLVLVSRKFGQSFIATHSTEIINEAAPGDVVSVNSKYANGRRISTDDSYRDLFKYLGSSENAEFSRISRAKRLVFFEGQDKKIIRRFAEKAENANLMTDTDTLFLQAGGFGQWHRIINTNWTLQALFGMEVRIVALFDRDYRTAEEILDFQNKITSGGVHCRVLVRKEIENYCLNPNVLKRTVIARALERELVVSENDVVDIIEGILDDMRIDTQSHLLGAASNYARKKNREADASTVNKEELKKFEVIWSTLEGRLSVVGGKDFISALSSTTQKKYGFSITVNQLIAEMRQVEVAKELKDILAEFEVFLGNTQQA